MTARRTATAPELVITRVFDAPRRLVYQAWTDPAHLVRWHCPRGFTMPSSQADIRPGGAYRHCMRAPDGTDHWIQGVYHELVALERLVFTWIYEGEDPRNETTVTVTFADQPGGKTKLTLRQVGFLSTEGRDEVQGGWTECLESLADHLAREP